MMVLYKSFRDGILSVQVKDKIRNIGMEEIRLDIYMICERIVCRYHFKQVRAHLFGKQLNGFKYCYIILKIQFNITYLVAHN